MTIAQPALPQLLRIRERFVVLHHERHDRLEVLLAGLQHGCAVADGLAEARSILHKIGGTAGTLGFMAFGTAAREVEYLIDIHLEGHGPDAAEIIRALDRLLDDSLRVCVPDI